MEKFYARVNGFNQNKDLVSVIVETVPKKVFGIRIVREQIELLKVGYIYFMETESFERKPGELSLRLLNFEEIFGKEPDTAIEEALKAFFPECEGLIERMNEINKFVDKINNVILKTITKKLLKRYSPTFFYYPAASRMHHNYLGGLARHTLGMLKMSESLKVLYSEINNDILISGIVLHDIMKIKEYKTPLEPEFTKEGHLLGHIPLGVAEITKEALRNGFEDSEEVLLLQHMMISHHGQLAFGSSRKPAFIEAFILHMLDNMNSKLTAITDALKKTSDFTFSENVAAAEKTSFYKHGIK
ncbi:MAG: HD domain-containing protein [Erysipelotrichales bacterium]|nr:HD domain-containing protein [Erysipelotrichales bacterium]